jgi:hypothetical protein
MSTTTGAAIRHSIESRIAALTPTSLASNRFVPHRHELPIAEWAEANPAGCLRRVSVRESPDVTPGDVTDGRVEWVWQDFTVAVAYPKSWRAGAKQLVDLDSLVAADRLQIVKTIGTPGFATLATTTQAATVIHTGETREDLGPVVLGIVLLRAGYYRSTT